MRVKYPKHPERVSKPKKNKVMKKAEKILNNVNNDKEIIKYINNDRYATIEQFVKDANRYIKAIKEGRVICSIGSVSRSGMSRDIKLLECSRQTSKYNYLNFWLLFKVLGFKESGKYDVYFRIPGGGMDMIFHTNYTIIHKLCKLGFITKKECDVLAQMTPTVI